MKTNNHNPKVKQAGEGMTLTARDEAIVRSVSQCRALTRPQIQRHHRFGSVVRTNATLLRLVRHSYLARRYQPTLAGTRRCVYLLGRRGDELLNGETVTRRLRGVSDLFLQHQLMLNDVRLAFTDCTADRYKFQKWMDEDELRRLRLPVVADGYVEYLFGDSHFAAFIEADRGTEGLSRWDAKVRAFVELAFSGLYQRAFHQQFFRTLAVVNSNERRQAIARRINLQTQQIFWLTTVEAIRREGPMASIWYRADGSSQHSLTEP